MPQNRDGKNPSKWFMCYAQIRVGMNHIFTLYVSVDRHNFQRHNSKTTEQAHQTPPAPAALFSFFSPHHVEKKFLLILWKQSQTSALGSITAQCVAAFAFMPLARGRVFLCLLLLLLWTLHPFIMPSSSQRLAFLRRFSTAAVYSFSPARSGGQTNMGFCCYFIIFCLGALL